MEREGQGGNSTVDPWRGRVKGETVQLTHGEGGSRGKQSC